MQLRRNNRVRRATAVDDPNPPHILVPPTVALTSPASGATGTAPAMFVLTAAVNDPDGFIQQVDFYRGPLLIRTVSPFNVASAARGATAVASSELVQTSITFQASGALDGDRKALNYLSGEAWHSGTNTPPHWLEITFDNTYDIYEIDVYSLQDNYTAPTDPTLTDTFTKYGLTDFLVQYWDTNVAPPPPPPPQPPPPPPPPVPPPPPPPPGPPPPPMPPPPAPLPGGRVLLSGLTVDGPSWLYANFVLNAGWSHAGGDWRDKNDVSQGLTPYATTTFTGATPQTVTTSGAGLAALVARLMTDNTGVLVHPVDFAPGQAQIFGILTAAIDKPLLTVVTDVGTYTPTLLITSYFDPGGTGTGVGNASPALELPFVMKWDFAGVFGTPTSSTSLRMESGFHGGASATVAIDFLDMPVCLTDPEIQMPDSVELGLRGTVAESDLAAHPSILTYNRAAKSTLTNQWANVFPTAVTGAVYSPGHQFADVQPLTFKTWPESGVEAIGVGSQWIATGGGTYQGVTLLSWRSLEPFASHGALPDLYYNFAIMLGFDIAANMTEGGVKLPGLASGNPAGGSITPPSGRDDSQFEMRLRHGKASPANPHVYRLNTYLYFNDWQYWDHQADGRILPPTAAFLRAGKKYSIEQHIRCNTPGLRDGLHEVWVNGVKVFYEPNISIRGDDATALIGRGEMQIFHGGGTAPAGTITYEIGPALIATQYIGPLRQHGP